jgi:group I intron endonuclease
MKTKLAFPGIYEIVHLASGRRYIGNSRNVSNRFYSHRYHLRNNSHPCPHLQNAWNKYGESAFEFRLIEQCLDEVVILLAREQHWIDKHSKRLYNSRKFAEQFIQEWYRTDESLETRKKASERMKSYRDNLRRELVCEQCEQQFVTNAPASNVRFCSEKCRGAFRYATNAYTESRICRTCGKEFLTSIYKKKEGEYCSRACAHESYRSLSTEQLIDVLTMVANGETCKKAGATYGLTASCVSNMAARTSYSHVELPDWLESSLKARTEANLKRLNTCPPDEQVLDIKTRLAKGETKCSIAKCAGVTLATVTRLLKGELGSHVEVPENLKAAYAERVVAKPYKLSVDQIKDIKIRLRNGETHASIGRLHGVAHSLITLIANDRLKFAATVSID